MKSQVSFGYVPLSDFSPSPIAVLALARMEREIGRKATCRCRLWPPAPPFSATLAASQSHPTRHPRNQQVIVSTKQLFPSTSFQAHAPSPAHKIRRRLPLSLASSFSFFLSSIVRRQTTFFFASRDLGLFDATKKEMGLIVT